MTSIARAKFDRKTQIIGSGLELWSELGLLSALELGLELGSRLGLELGHGQYSEKKRFTCPENHDFGRSLLS